MKIVKELVLYIAMYIWLLKTVAESVEFILKELVGNTIIVVTTVLVTIVIADNITILIRSIINNHKEK